MNKPKMILAIALMMLSANANAQFGGLKKLKDKVTKEAKNTASNKVEVTAATASLNDEQKWALNQLKTLSEAPPLPNLMKPEPNAKVPASTNIDTPIMIKHLAEGLDKPAHDQVVNVRGLLNNRLAYNMRIKKAIESLPNGLLPLDQDYRLRNRLDTLEYQNLLFECLQQNVANEMGMRFTDQKAKRDANGKMVMRVDGMVWPLTGGKTYIPVRKDKDGKCKFFDNEKHAFTKITEDGVKDQQRYLAYLENGLILLEQNDLTLDMYKMQNISSSNLVDIYDRAKLAVEAVKEALANNK